MGLLKQAGYVEVDKDGFLKLTEQGRLTARNIYERHTVLTAALMALGIDRETAAEDACKIEHVISEKTLAAIKEHMANFEPT